MKQWWEIESPDLPGSVPRIRAVAYYRHSAQDRQENSIPIQRDQVREWAQKNGVEIIHEFADAAKFTIRMLRSDEAHGTTRLNCPLLPPTRMLPSEGWTATV